MRGFVDETGVGIVIRGMCMVPQSCKAQVLGMVITTHSSLEDAGIPLVLPIFTVNEYYKYYYCSSNLFLVWRKEEMTIFKSRFVFCLAFVHYVRTRIFKCEILNLRLKRNARYQKYLRARIDKNI